MHGRDLSLVVQEAVVAYGYVISPALTGRVRELKHGTVELATGVVCAVVQCGQLFRPALASRHTSVTTHNTHIHTHTLTHHSSLDSDSPVRAEPILKHLHYSTLLYSTLVQQAKTPSDSNNAMQCSTVTVPVTVSVWQYSCKE
jgi:hypothetical protein